MRKRFLKNQAAMSLAEIMVVAALTGILALAGSLLFTSGTAAWFSTEGHTRLQEDVRKVLERVARELRQTNAVQLLDSDTIRFAIPIICGEPEKLICHQPENLALVGSGFSASHTPLNGQAQDLVQGNPEIAQWDFTGRSEIDPVVVYYDLGAGIPGDSRYAIRAGNGGAAPKYWCYQESDILPGQEGEGEDPSLCKKTGGDWTLLGGNKDDDLSWASGELKVFNSGLGLKRYRRLVIEESHQSDRLEMREVRVINDELVWGAPVTWGCTDSGCMEEYHRIEYGLNAQDQLVRTVLDGWGNVVQTNILATGVTGVITQADILRIAGITEAEDKTGVYFYEDGPVVGMIFSAQVTTSRGRVLTSLESMEVHLRNR